MTQRTFKFPLGASFVIFWTFYQTVICDDTISNSSEFYIDYNRNTFVKDGKPFRYISGSFHYFRTVEDKWDDILRKFRLAGLNAVQTYVEWASHQPTSAHNFTFEGNLNIFKFFNLAEKNNLSVILRVGPYIDAERDMGGIPPWLLWQSPEMKLRSTQSDFVYYVSNWFGVLLTMVKPYLHKNGGPIILVQVENEYGSFGCDSEYKLFLRDLIQFHLGNDIILFSTDGAVDSKLRCGKIPGVYPTVDFPPEGIIPLIDLHFATQRVAAPRGPLVNSEFYIGWFDSWGSRHSKKPTDLVTASLERILQLGANVNFYMFFGGTSFGLTSGAAILDDVGFSAYTTSYNYDAALDEAGDPTEKYFAIKSVISQFTAVPEENPGMSPKASYGNVKMERMGSLFDERVMRIIDPKPIVSLFPQRFENLNVASGFVMYETYVDIVPRDPALLIVQDLKDRGYVYVDKVLVGILDRSQNINAIPLSIKMGQKLSILVENLGRPSFGPQISESKGIGPEVKLGRHLLNSWKHYRIGSIHGRSLRKITDELSQPFSFEGFTNEINSDEDEFPAVIAPASPLDLQHCLFQSPWGKLEEAGAFYRGTFTINSTESLADTYVNMENWSKGLLWINGIHVGRYWPKMGPQKTLYLPRNLLHVYPKENVMIMFELEASPFDCAFGSFSQSSPMCSVSLVDQPILDGPTPD